MNNIKLSIGITSNPRTWPIIDGAVKVEGVDLTPTVLHPSELFWRQLRFAEFDVAEMSMSSLMMAKSKGDERFVGIPVFTTRMFFHTRILVRKDANIDKPADLKGKRVGVPEYQLTANVWARDILEQEHGIAPADVTWVRGGYEQPGRVEKITLDLPASLRLEDAPRGATISGMLADGSIDALIGPRAPSCFERGHPHVGWLYPDPIAAASAWYRKTGIFPIMHLVGIRRSLAERHPFLPAAMAKAFGAAKSVALAKLTDTSATKVTLPFVEEQLAQARALMGPDFWSYGVAPNRTTLDAFLHHHHAQGLSPRRLAVEELFHPATLEMVKV